MNNGALATRRASGATTAPRPQQYRCLTFSSVLNSTLTAWPPASVNATDVAKAVQEWITAVGDKKGGGGWSP